MVEKHRPIKNFFTGSGYVLRLLSLLLAIIALGISAAYAYFNKLAETYSEDLFAQTLIKGAAPQYEAARSTASLFGGLMAFTLLLCYLLIIVIFQISKRRLADENARVMEEKFRLEASEARYRLIALDSASIIVEVNYAEKTIEANEFFEKFAGQGPRYDYFLNGTRVHPDDRSVFFEMLSEVRGNLHYSSRELRLRDAKGNFVWFSVITRGLVDKDGVVTCVICKFTNIDAQKRKMALLELQAQIDRMTGLYNKTVTEEIITRTLKEEPDAVHAMLILDLDDLKSINDTCGHCEGDKAIKGITSLLRSHFRSTDVAGRIGGDEFMVFLKNIGSAEQLVSTVGSFQRRLEMLYVGEGDGRQVSASIGAVLTDPLRYESFQQLYKKADAALYHVKHNGKNGFAIYTAEMESAQ